jgi:hypothetical protein
MSSHDRLLTVEEKLVSDSIHVRVEAKLDKLLTNHLPHLEGKVDRLNARFEEQRIWLVVIASALLTSVVGTALVQLLAS